MALFLIEHSHSAEHCPTHNPEMVRRLMDHVSEENTKELGVKIVADWANDSEHRAVFVIEAGNLDQAKQFAQPFQMFGNATIKEGSTCQQIAEQCLRQKAA